ncbi:hypothetical protein BS17DRAFT_819790 [Gyrodon lividus]|nr:hypothetical protein BS17DRAFT_819790 [Gyrodon lividus]
MTCPIQQHMSQYCQWHGPGRPFWYCSISSPDEEAQHYVGQRKRAHIQREVTQAFDGKQPQAAITFSSSSSFLLSIPSGPFNDPNSTFASTPSPSTIAFGSSTITPTSTTSSTASFTTCVPSCSTPPSPSANPLVEEDHTPSPSTIAFGSSTITPTSTTSSTASFTTCVPSCSTPPSPSANPLVEEDQYDVAYQ